MGYCIGATICSGFRDLGEFDEDRDHGGGTVPGRGSESVQSQRKVKVVGKFSPFENSVRHGHLCTLSFLRFDGDHEASTRVQLAFDGLIDFGSCARDVFVDDSSSERREHGERFGRRDHHSRSSRSVVAEHSSH